MARVPISLTPQFVTAAHTIGISGHLRSSRIYIKLLRSSCNYMISAEKIWHISIDGQCLRW